MIWLFFHAGLALGLLTYTWKRGDRLHIDNAVALAYWFILRQGVYEYGEIEREGMFVVMAAFLVFNGINFAKYKHWTNVFLLLVGLTVCLLNYLWTGGAYCYKTALGVCFALSVLVVFLSCHTRSFGNWSRRSRGRWSLWR